jgi:hypothetical protein
MSYANASLAHGILRLDRHTQFTVVDQRTIQDNRLSLKSHSILMHLLSMPKNWQYNVQHLKNYLAVGEYTIRKSIKELRDLGYLIYDRVRDGRGRFIGSVRIIRETPDCVGSVVGGEVINPDGDTVLSTSRSSTGRSATGGKSTPLTNIQIKSKEIINQHLPDEVDVDINFFGEDTEQQPLVSCQEDDPETVETSSQNVSELPTLATDEISVETDIPPACDEKIQVTTNLEHIDYRAKLAAIGVAVQNVDWVIQKLDPSERATVVVDAIAWVSEQRWIKQPAAAFVSAVKKRKKSGRIVDIELREIIDQHKTEAQQFTEWYNWGKMSGLVDYSCANAEHYAVVVMGDGIMLPWREARDKFPQC